MSEMLKERWDDKAITQIGCNSKAEASYSPARAALSPHDWSTTDDGWSSGYSTEYDWFWDAYCNGSQWDDSHYQTADDGHSDGQLTNVDEW